MQKQLIVLVAVSIFFASLFIMQTLHSYNQTIDNFLQKEKTQKIINAYDLFAWEVPPDWKKPEKDLERLKLLDNDEREIREEKKFEKGMTREELGRHGWALLHMVSSTLPVDFNDDFQFKLNLYLNLFGQFYPCKLCSGHFLDMLKNNPYQGNTREDFMQYLCTLHNFVNKRLHKQTFECPKIHDTWGGYCGCEEEFKRSIDKYDKIAKQKNEN